MESGRTHELPRYRMPIEDMVYSYNYYDYMETKNLNVYSISSNCMGRFNNISEYPIGYSYVTETFDDGSFVVIISLHWQISLIMRSLGKLSLEHRTI